MSVRKATERRITALITALLLTGALMFAWVRSRHAGDGAAGGAGAAIGAAGPGGAAGAGGAAAAGGAALPATAEASLALGRSLYAQECGLCHGSDAEDRAEVGRRSDGIYRSGPDGTPLLDFLLHGSADEEHPPFDHLSDERVAALLAYLLAYGDADVASGARPAITPQDVAARRAGR